MKSILEEYGLIVIGALIVLLIVFGAPGLGKDIAGGTNNAIKNMISNMHDEDEGGSGGSGGSPNGGIVEIYHWQQNTNGDAASHDTSNYSLRDKQRLMGVRDETITPDTKDYVGFFGIKIVITFKY